MKAVYDNNIIYLYKVPIVISLYFFLFRMILIYLWMCLYNNWDLLLLWCSSTFSFLENAVCPRVFSVSSTMYLCKYTNMIQGSKNPLENSYLPVS